MISRELSEEGGEQRDADSKAGGNVEPHRGLLILSMVVQGGAKRGPPLRKDRKET